MTALILLSHEPADCVNRMVAHWRELTKPVRIVVAYGGPEAEFAGIEGGKVFIEDPRLRTRDHQREEQSYSRVLSAALRELAGAEWDACYLAEYDMLPLVPDFWDRLRSYAGRERADLLGYRAWRIDNTLHPHLGKGRAAAEWRRWLGGISVREDKGVVLSCLGCGQWWRRETLEAVVAAGEPVPAYLELHLPSVAHHLGFRVRGMDGQDHFVQTCLLPPGSRESMKSGGAWIIHPEKNLWAAPQ